MIYFDILEPTYKFQVDEFTTSVGTWWNLPDKLVKPCSRIYGFSVLHKSDYVQLE